MAWWTPKEGKRGYGKREFRKAEARHTRGERRANVIEDQFLSSLEPVVAVMFECPHGLEFTPEQAKSMDYQCPHEKNHPHIFPRSQ